MEPSVPLPPDPPAVSELEGLLDHAFRLADRGDVRVGRALAEQALAQARTDQDATRTARALGIVANASRGLADYERAAAAALESIGLLESTGAGLASAKIDLALVFFDLGDYPKAVAHLSDARRELAHLPDRGIEARCAHVDGLVQTRLSEFELARASFQRALALRRAAGDDAGAATTLNSLGVVHLRLAQLPSADGHVARTEFDRALDLFHQARELALQQSDDRLALLAEINIASAVDGLGCYNEALERFLAQLSAARELGDRHNESLILASAGEAARRAGQLERASRLGEEALHVAQATSSNVREREARLQLSLTCEAAGDHAAALEHYKVHHALERESHAAEARRVAHAQAFGRAVEHAQREGARLRRENRVLQRQARRTP